MANEGLTAEQMAGFRQMVKDHEDLTARQMAGFRQMVKEEAQKPSVVAGGVSGAIVGGLISIIVAAIPPVMSAVTGASTFERNAAIEAIKAAGDEPGNVEKLLDLLCKRHFITQDRDKRCPP